MFGHHGFLEHYRQPESPHQGIFLHIAIEVDGAEYHEGRPTMDNARDAMLQGHGYRVVRVPAREIFETPYNVLEKIRQQAQLAH